MALQRIGFIRALKHHLMLEFMGDIANMPQARLARRTMKKRGGLWDKGVTKDIKKGNYFSFCNFIPAQMKDPELYDRVKLFRNSQDGLGWTRGLDRNIYLKIAGKHVLVMDNHNYAAAFIIEMFRRGVIKAKSSMIHADYHADYLGFMGSFNYKDYAALTTEAEKVRYLMQKTSVEDWQVPLFRNNIVNKRKWSWIAIKGNGPLWCEKDPILPFLEGSIKSLGSISHGNRLDIADIDIDVLLPLDKGLSDAQKAGVLRGDIPQEIMDKLKDIAWIAGRAKVLTIATSPCFIQQDRALVYVKALLSLLRKSSIQASKN